MICVMCGGEFQPKRSFEKICPTCRKDTQKVRAYYRRRTWPLKKRYCADCGKLLEHRQKMYCADCSTPEKRKERRRIYDAERYPKLLQAQKERVREETLDIALFFIVRCGMTVKQAAAQIFMEEKTLAEFLTSKAGTEEYRRTEAYYLWELIQKTKVAEKERKRNEQGHINRQFNQRP